MVEQITDNRLIYGERATRRTESATGIIIFYVDKKGAKAVYVAAGNMHRWVALKELK